MVSGLPRLQPCEVPALQIGHDFVGDPAVNVQFLAHFRSPFLVWVASADATLPKRRAGVASGRGLLGRPSKATRSSRPFARNRVCLFTAEAPWSARGQRP